ncbi:hypothetical protein TNCV_111481 [Trichonephila clavipes]|nr:hypothetical protein TNCV_111481 [Trichonephila clavipes]
MPGHYTSKGSVERSNKNVAAMAIYLRDRLENESISFVAIIELEPVNNSTSTPAPTVEISIVLLTYEEEEE